MQLEAEDLAELCQVDPQDVQVESSDMSEPQEAYSAAQEAEPQCVSCVEKISKLRQQLKDQFMENLELKERLEEHEARFEELLKLTQLLQSTLLEPKKKNQKVDKESIELDATKVIDHEEEQKLPQPLNKKAKATDNVIS